LLAGDVKKPTYLSKRVGDGVSGVVVWLDSVFCISWVATVGALIRAVRVV